MAATLDNCRFTPTAGGTSDWVYSSAVSGSQSPTAAGAVNGRVYRFLAMSGDLLQWELAYGAYNSSTGTFARTTVITNSSGTTSKINFTAVPQVSIVLTKEDVISVEEANSFTTTQQQQARDNIDASRASSGWTITVLTSGSGTYTTPANCKALKVRMVGAGGGGGGGASAAAGGGIGGTGGNTTFGSSFMTANGGGGGGPGGNAFQSGGAASGGDVNVSGGFGQASFGAGNLSTVYQGALGGGSFFGGGGSGGWPGANGASATAYGAGGGGGGCSTAGQIGAGGAAGGYCEKVIAGPSSTYAYSVGSGGGSGVAGTGGSAGGAGAGGIIIIEEYY
jgi:hypothetical protein